MFQNLDSKLLGSCKPHPWHLVCFDDVEPTKVWNFQQSEWSFFLTSIIVGSLIHCLSFLIICQFWLISCICLLRLYTFLRAKCLCCSFSWGFLRWIAYLSVKSIICYLCLKWLLLENSIIKCLCPCCVQLLCLHHTHILNHMSRTLILPLHRHLVHRFREPL